MRVAGVTREELSLLSSGGAAVATSPFVAEAHTCEERNAGAAACAALARLLCTCRLREAAGEARPYCGGTKVLIAAAQEEGQTKKTADKINSRVAYHHESPP
jgi:hypothetical protein